MVAHARPLIATAVASIAFQFDSLISLFMQQISAIPPAVSVTDGWAQMAEHLTLTGALIIAVAILWKSLAAKDQLLIASTKTVTDALNASATSNSELRKIIQDSVDAKVALTATISDLQRSLERMSDRAQQSK